MSFSYLKPGESAVFKDRHTTKVNECVQPFVEGNSGDIGLIGLPSSKSSISLSRAAEAPATIRSALASYSTYSGEQERDFAEKKILDFGDVPIHPTSIEESLERMRISIEEMLEKEACDRYIMLGGDHGISFPSISAFKEHYGRVGIIQWDAHHDLRNLEDGGRTNGTPFRSLLEAGIIKGEDLVQVGIRDFSNAKAYHDYAREQGIKVYTMDDIDQYGLNRIISEQLTRLSQQVDMIYLSVDMDAVDQAFAPGCPAIGPGGLTSRELLSSVRLAAQHEKVKAMDIVEIDPSKDVRDITSRLAAHVMLRFIF
ncbi:formimidoylglutamase [Thalassobacillus pellis]|uniref:formimidoylglutamase n=1 Tax=Thalassobacillus pellis TaxID=748008 RepID=UPI00196225A5|nr:formimidoylglutamase [Thalassobacillus pellis]